MTTERHTRALRQRIFLVLTMVSLIGFVASLSIWIAQSFRPIIVHDGTRYHGVEWFIAEPGQNTSWRVRFDGFDYPSSFIAKEIPVTEAPPLLPEFEYIIAFAHGYLDVCRAYYHATPDKSADPSRMVLSAAHSSPIRVHLAIPMLVLGLLPAVVLGRAGWFRLRRRRWRRQGRCLRCGYDLRASAGCCPECGSEPELRAATLGTG